MPLSPYANISPQLSKMTVSDGTDDTILLQQCAAGNRDALALLVPASYRHRLPRGIALHAQATDAKTQCRSHSSIYFSAIQHPAITELRA